MKILYVEDNEDNIYLLKRRLGRDPVTIVVAMTGAEGIRLAASEKPDVILMDLDLPDIDGWEATRRLRANVETQSIPVIALSAGATAEDRDQALAAGCNAYDTKPIDFARLKARIDAVVKKP